MFRVLIADDNFAVRNAVTNLLIEQYPHIEIYEACTGAEAVGSAMTDMPNLIIMDDVMPMMDGKTAAHILRCHPRTCEIPIVGLLTGNHRPTTCQLVDDLFDHIVAKPVAMGDLEQAVHQVSVAF